MPIYHVHMCLLSSAHPDWLNSGVDKGQITVLSQQGLKQFLDCWLVKTNVKKASNGGDISLLFKKSSVLGTEPGGTNC